MRAARDCAARYRAHVVLKGVGTVVARPDAHFAINTSGNPGLASAGMGDALCGILAALLAQGSPGGAGHAPLPCFCTATPRIASGPRVGGPLGLTASEVIDAARSALNEAIYRDA